MAQIWPIRMGQMGFDNRYLVDCWGGGSLLWHCWRARWGRLRGADNPFAFMKGNMPEYRSDPEEERPSDEASETKSWGHRTSPWIDTSVKRANQGPEPTDLVSVPCNIGHSSPLEPRWIAGCCHITGTGLINERCLVMDVSVRWKFKWCKMKNFWKHARLSLFLDIFQSPRGHWELENMAHWKTTMQIITVAFYDYQRHPNSVGSKTNFWEKPSEIQSHLLNLEIWLSGEYMFCILN